MSEQATIAGGNPAELLSGRQVARLLHRRTQDVLDDIASGRIPSLGGRVPLWALIEWQRSQIERAG